MENNDATSKPVVTGSNPVENATYIVALVLSGTTFFTYNNIIAKDEYNESVCEVYRL